MRLAAVIGTSMLGLFLGAAPLAKAQHGNDDGRQGDSKKHEDAKHQKEHGRSPGQHGDKHEGKGAEKQRDQRSHEQPRTDHDRAERREPHNQPSHGREHVREANWHEHEEHSRRREVWEGHRAHHWEHEHHSWRERGGYRGYRIPEDHFRAHFGRGHWFRVHTVPVIIVAGRPRFQYGGFWFSMVDPWPEYWAPTWYETDEVYVDYVNDGYYMYNRRHPGVAIAINVSL
jgi:hypothetical protein